jgi:hypothetical protein
MYAVVAALISTPGMWLPSEAVKVRNWSYTGYVLSANDQWTTMLDRDKQIQVFNSADIRSRTPCVLKNSWSSRLVWDIWRDKPRHPVCPH